MNFIEINVEEHETEQRIDRFLKKKFPNLTQIGIEQALRKSLIKLNNKKIEAKTYVAGNDVIKMAEFLIHSPKPEKNVKEPTLKLSNKQIEFWLDRILYQDPDVIIINKPIGIAVQGGTGITQSLDDILEVFQFDDYPEKPKLVHRLDRDTSGVLILARSRKAASLITKMFQQKLIQKIYHAVVVGDLIGSGIIKKPIIDQDTQKTNTAATEYRVLDCLKKYVTLVELKPLTGRKHQLRIHCADSLKLPILADYGYGGDKAFLEGFGNKMHLHAKHIIFELNGRKIKVTAPVPDHFLETYRVAAFKDKDWL